jgi:hypothetical protein
MQPRFNRIEAGLPRTKASLQSYNSSLTFNSQKIKHYYKPFQTLVHVYKHCFKTTSYASLWGVTAEEKFVTRLHTSRKLTPNSTQIWCHSGGSLPAENGSHSTDQPNGTEVGHAGPSVGFSKIIPENRLAKLSIIILSKT